MSEKKTIKEFVDMDRFLEGVKQAIPKSTIGNKKQGLVTLDRVYDQITQKFEFEMEDLACVLSTLSETGLIKFDRSLEIIEDKLDKNIKKVALQFFTWCGDKK